MRDRRTDPFSRDGQAKAGAGRDRETEAKRPARDPAVDRPRRPPSRPALLGSAAAVALLAQPQAALAAPPAFLNVCTGLGVTLPIAQQVQGVTGGLLAGLLAPVSPVLDTLVGNVNTSLGATLSGQTIGVGVIDPATGALVTVPGSCNLSVDGLRLNNGVGLSLGGGVVGGFGGIANAPAVAGTPGAIAFGNGAVTGGAAPNAIALGAGASALGAGSVALGAGSSDGGAANVVSVGSPGAERRIANVAAGTLATDVATLGQVQAGVAPLAAASRLAVGYVADAANNPTPVVDLAGNPDLPGGTARVALTGVAPGALAAGSTGAVNGGQLFATGASTAAALGAGSTYDPATGRVGLPSFAVGTGTYASVGDAFGAVNALLSGPGTGAGGASASNNASGASPALAAGSNALAGGFGASATGSASTVLGNGATDRGAANATVLGNGASVAAGLAGSNVALGQGAAATRGSLTASPAFGLAGPQTSAGEVSVGSAAAPRQVTHVAAGTADTDAATLGQVRGASAALGTALGASLGGGATYDPTTNTVTTPSYTVQGTAYTTIGGALNALQASVNGVGNQRYFQANSALPDAQATAADAVAVGPLAVAAGPSAVALGKGAVAGGAGSVAIGAGSTDGGRAGVVSVGAAGAERRVTNVAAGLLSAASTDAVTGGQLYQTDTRLASLGRAALRYDTDAAGDPLPSVTLSGGAGGPVVIHNLAPGVAPGDAATVGQLQASIANGVQYASVGGMRSNTVALAGGSPGGVTISNLAAGVAAGDAVNLGQLQSAASGALGQSAAYTDQRVGNLSALTQRQINRAREDAAGGTALALAATGLRYQDLPGKVSVAGSTAYYHDQMGLAFGLGATSEDGRFRVNAALSASPTMARPDLGAVVGASMVLN